MNGLGSRTYFIFLPQFLPSFRPTEEEALGVLYERRCSSDGSVVSFLTKVSNFGGGFGPSDGGVRDGVSRASANKNHYNPGGAQTGQRGTEQAYGGRQQGYETDFSR